MNITEYADLLRSKSKGPKADIRERWNTRIVAQGLDKAGHSGAGDYLARYGKGVSAKKVADLALMAEFAGATEMAAGFWEKAFHLETGLAEAFNGSPDSTPPAIPVTSRTLEPTRISGFPADFQPGSIVTMQPVDAPRPQSAYVLDRGYIGQPKRDGIRNVVFVTADAVAHQSRSTSILPSIGSEFDEAAKVAASKIGSFVLDGERLYLSAEGKEHRTAAQAASENVSLGLGTVAPVTKFSAFKALFHKTSLLEATELDRVRAAAVIVEAINAAGCGKIVVEATPTAHTAAEKQALIDQQRAEGREGEVWTRVDCRYSGGKGHKTDALRTKYLTEIVATIVGFTSSSADGRFVGAFEVEDASGKRIGKVGTGFDDHTARLLVARHNAAPGSVKIEVVCQGFTEAGQLWHPRMIAVAA